MKIPRELALTIIRYLIDNPKFYFPFDIGCKGIYGCRDYDPIPIQEEDYLMFDNFKEYDDFVLVENLQHLFEDTIQLMSKGFIEKITSEGKI